MAAVISSVGYAQSTYEQDMARQGQHVYDENMRAQQQRQAGQQGAPPPYQPRQAMKWVSNHGAVAAHIDATNYWVATGARSFEDAGRLALDQCEQAMGPGCSLLIDGSNGQFAIGVASDGTIAVGFGGTPADARKGMRKTCEEYTRECLEEPFVSATPWLEPASWGALEAQIAEEVAPNIRFITPSRVQRRSHLLLALPKNYSEETGKGSIWIGAGPKWNDLGPKLLAACREDSGTECEIRMSVSGPSVIVEFRNGAGEDYIRTAASASAADAMVAEHCKTLSVVCTITKIHRTTDTQFGRLPPAVP
jgi:hypothetical protein